MTLSCKRSINYLSGMVYFQVCSSIQHMQMLHRKLTWSKRRNFLLPTLMCSVIVFLIGKIYPPKNIFTRNQTFTVINITDFVFTINSDACDGVATLNYVILVNSALQNKVANRYAPDQVNQVNHCKRICLSVSLSVSS